MNLSGWDSWDINRHSDHRLMPFELKFNLPKLRKDRIIFGRDEFCRILSSKVRKIKLSRQ